VRKSHPDRDRFWHGLSGRVLWLTIVFVMLGEVLIFLPSIANFRIQWLKGRIAQAEIAALAAEAAPNQILSSDLRSEILKGAGVLVVSLQKGEVRQLMLRGSDDVMVDESFDLRTTRWYSAISEAFGVLFRGGGERVISVIDKPPNMSGDEIEITLYEEPLRQAMLKYGFNILMLSIVLSLLVAGMIYAALNSMLVRPMRRLMRNMMEFAQDPEDASRIIVPSRRRDEIGLAEHELQAMQNELASALKQKSHLAALGLAVSKVSHDLRNMLTSAQIISDRLASVPDPTVQRFTPKLISSLDRAIEFLSQTLRFGRAEEAPPRRERLMLFDICAEVVETAELNPSRQVRFVNMVPRAISIDADREQLIRILTNLVRNAVQAIEQRSQADGEEGRVMLQGRREGSVTVVTVSDNGPGLPDKIRDHLFQAFQTAAKSGGTGLGLAIAEELARAHGGYIALRASNIEGTSFEVHVPDRVEQLAERRSEAGRRSG
jgi:signal transduction histidine kinase